MEAAFLLVRTGLAGAEGSAPGCDAPLLARRRTMLQLDRPRLPAALTALVISLGTLIAFL